MYSRLVAWLKILLPLAALAILSSVVFFAQDADDVRDIPFVSGESDQTGERIGKPEYMSVTSDGTTLRITAERVTPRAGDAGTLVATDIVSQMVTPSGRVIDASAPSGEITLSQDLSNLIGDVAVSTSDGFDVLADGLSMRHDITFAETNGEIRGEAPFGTLDAGRLRVDNTERGSDLLVFNGGVKLIYVPRRTQP